MTAISAPAPAPRQEVFRLHVPDENILPGVPPLPRSLPVYASLKLGDERGYSSVDDAVTAAKSLTSGEQPAALVYADSDRFHLRELKSNNEYYLWGEPLVFDGGPKLPFHAAQLSTGERLSGIHPAAQAIVDGSTAMLIPAGTSHLSLR